MTYGEAIDKKRQEAEKIYNECGSLRDVADLNEKEHWNNLRRLLYECDSEFRKLNDKVCQGDRFDMKIKGIY